MTMCFTMYYCRLLLVLFLGVNIFKSHAAFEPLCKDITLKCAFDLYISKLEMGFKNPIVQTDEDIEETIDVIKVNAVCGVKTICLSFLHHVALFLKNGEPSEENDVKANVTCTNPIFKQLLAILYNIDANDGDLYPIWLCHLYFFEFRDYWNFLKNTTDLPVERLTAINTMLVNELQKSMDGCPEHNTFDVTDMQSDCHVKFAKLIKGDQTYQKAFESYKKFYGTVDKLINSLPKCMIDNCEEFDVNNLYFHYDSQYENEISELPKLYGPNIQWGTMPDALDTAFEKAKTPETLYNGLKDLQRFQLIYLTRLKMIMLRLLWSYILLAAKEEEAQTIDDANKIMHETLNSFVKVTGFKDDDTFTKISSYLSHDGVKVAEQTAESQSVVETIRIELANSCSPFEGCDATSDIEGDLSQISQIYEKVIQFVLERKRYKKLSSLGKEFKEKANGNRKKNNSMLQNLKCAVLFSMHVDNILGWLSIDMDLHKSLFAIAVEISKENECRQ